MKFLLVKLVELMIVVAIIGSIGVLGLNMYQDVSEDVKSGSAKRSYNTVVQYITLELMRCEITTTVMDGNLTCSELNATNVVDAAAKTLTDKNPYSPNNYSVSSSGQYSYPGNEGYVAVWQSGSTVTVITCYQSPCAPDDRLTNIINIE